MIYHHCTHRWEREEIEPGIWISLGLKVDDEVMEVTGRKFVSFWMRNGTADGTDRWFFTVEPLTFDHIVVARQPAGQVADVLHNGRALTTRANDFIHITPRWDEAG